MTDTKAPDRAMTEDEIWNDAIKQAAERAYSWLTPYGSPIGWNRADKMRAQLAADAGNAVMSLLRKDQAPATALKSKETP